MPWLKLRLCSVAAGNKVVVILVSILFMQFIVTRTVNFLTKNIMRKLVDILLYRTCQKACAAIDCIERISIRSDVSDMGIMFRYIFLLNLKIKGTSSRVIRFSPDNTYIQLRESNEGSH